MWIQILERFLLEGIGKGTITLNFHIKRRKVGYLLIRLFILIIIPNIDDDNN